jgi:[ribosomal protein S5]-alanine N-acetyltransferase
MGGFMHNEIFHTERLTARTWELADLSLAIELWGDEDVTRFIDSRGKLNRDQILERLRVEIDRQNVHGVQYWPLFETQSNQFIGCCGLRPWIYTPQEKNYELGFHILKRCWGKGYATEAAKGAIKYALEKLVLRFKNS